MLILLITLHANTPDYISLFSSCTGWRSIHSNKESRRGRNVAASLGLRLETGSVLLGEMERRGRVSAGEGGEKGWKLIFYTWIVLWRVPWSLMCRPVGTYMFVDLVLVNLCAVSTCVCYLQCSQYVSERWHSECQTVSFQCKYRDRVWRLSTRSPLWLGLQYKVPGY